MLIKIPLTGWQVSKKKKTSLSMNCYRNWHYQTSNKIKKAVSIYLLKYEFPKYDKISIEYTLYFKDKRERDIMNFVSIADKFLLDHLVNPGCLEDDNYKHVVSYIINPVILGSEENYLEVKINEK